MPFDPMPVQPVETKPGVFTLEGLRDWLRKQPGETTYRYADSCGCLLFRYFTDRGIPVRAVGSDYYYTNDYRPPKVFFPGELWQVSIGSEKPKDWTYAAALARCLALMEEQSK